MVFYFSNCYDLKNMLFDCRYALKKNRDDWLDATVDNVAPMNNIVSSLFKSVKLQLNNVTINRDDDHYHIESYLHDMYTYDILHKDSILRPGGWYADTNNFFDAMDDSTQNIEPNIGFHLRKLLFMTATKTYKKFHGQFISKIHTDFQGSVNGLLNSGVDVRLDFTLNDPGMYLMSSTSSNNK